VFKIQDEGKVLSPVRSTIWVTVACQSINLQHRWLIQWS